MASVKCGGRAPSKPLKRSVSPIVNRSVLLRGDPLESQRPQQKHQQVISPDLVGILRELKHVLVDKYPALELRLFGSTARGEATGTSDIDLCIQLPDVTRSIEEDLFDTTYAFELKYDRVFDVIILAESLVQKYSDVLPIYQNILREGIVL